MPLTEQQQREILLADHARYMSRQQREDALLSNDPTSRAALEDWTCERPLLKGLGSVTPPRKYPNREPRTRVHGAAAMPRNAEDAENLAAGNIEATVLCYNANDPSNVTVRTVAEIRGRRESRKNRATVSNVRTVEVQSLPSIHIGAND
jgi:hypothetical protein